MLKFVARKWTEQVQISKQWDVALVNSHTNTIHYFPDMCFRTKEEAEKAAAEFTASKAYEIAKQWPIDDLAPSENQDVLV